MKVFIQNEAGSAEKNYFNEKTLEFIKSVEISSAYPYAYGFILDTPAEDGDNLDCFVITDKPLRAGEIVECETIGVMEQFESSWDPSKKDVMESDHNILAVLQGESRFVNEEVKSKLTDFIQSVFSHIPGKQVEVGAFLDKEHAEALVVWGLDT